MNKSPHIRLRPLINDPKWNILEDYLRESVDNLRIRLETCGSHELENLQGQVLAQRNLLNMKATLTAEWKS